MWHLPFLTQNEASVGYVKPIIPVPLTFLYCLFLIREEKLCLSTVNLFCCFSQHFQLKPFDLRDRTHANLYFLQRWFSSLSLEIIFFLVSKRSSWFGLWEVFYQELLGTEDPIS